MKKSIKKEAYELHPILNPKLWFNNKLKPEVAEKLNDISKEFLDFIELPINLVDIDIVGSNASYNYNSQSDIDLHFVVNNELSYIDETILQQLYDSKKSSFNRNFDIDIYGIPVELYIEDVNAGNATNGRYSILKNTWIQKPKPVEYDIPDISEELDATLTKCNEMLNSNDMEAVQKYINELYMNRKVGLAEEGEMSLGNLIFKALRNQNMLQKLKDHYFDLKGKSLSLEESKRKVVTKLESAMQEFLKDIKSL